MDKIMEGILNDVAKENGVDLEEVGKVYQLPYKYIREKIVALELHGKTSEDIEGLKTNFNMPALFKLYLNKNKLNKLNTKEEKNNE
jgi:hypothetical protein